MSSTPEKKVQDAERAPEDISDSVVKLSVSEASRGRTARSETPMTNLAPFEWDTLERHYHEAMQERDEVEKKINLEFQSMVEIFSVWAQTSSSHDSERSQKRLRTRMAYVQNAETKMSKKKEHYEQVVNAFKSAMELLANVEE